MYAMRPHDHIVKDHPALPEMLRACRPSDWVVVDSWEWSGPYATSKEALQVMRVLINARIAL